MADYPFQPRPTLYAAYASAGASTKELLSFQVQLDIRDLMRRTAMATSVDGEDIQLMDIDEYVRENPWSVKKEDKK